jgi:hypothetical protein
VHAIVSSIQRLPPDLSSSLLRAIAGLYCDPRQDVRVRDNIKHVAPSVWDTAPDSARGEIGLKYANYAANGDVDRRLLAHEFLDLVNGLTYLPDSELALAIQEAVNRLEVAHDGWDNFYNEPPLARILKKFVPATGLIPSQVIHEYVRVLVRCRVGRPAGVARNAAPIYDELIDLFDKPQVRAFVFALEHVDVTGRLEDAGCADRFQTIVAKLVSKTIDIPLSRILNVLAGATAAQLPSIWRDSRFQRLVAAI